MVFTCNGQMVNEFMAYQLLNNYTKSTTVRNFVDKYDFYIFPVVNPDGLLPVPVCGGRGWLTQRDRLRLLTDDGAAVAQEPRARGRQQLRRHRHQPQLERRLGPDRRGLDQSVRPGLQGWLSPRYYSYYYYHYYLLTSVV